MYELMTADPLPPKAELTAGHVRQYLTEVAAEEARRSLRTFAKRGWGQLQPETPTWNWHMDAICLPGDALVETECGPMSIGDIVDRRWQGRVLSYSHNDAAPQWKPITRWMQSPSQDLLNITFSDGGRLEITGNHPVYVDGRGYTRADLLRPGDVVVRLRGVRAGVRKAQEQRRQVLQPEVFWAAQDHSGTGDLSGLWRPEGLGKQGLQSLLWAPPPPLANAFVSTMWQCGVSERGPLGRQFANPWSVLQSGLLCQVRDRSAQSGLYARLEPGSIPQGFPCHQNVDPGAGRGSLLYLPDHGAHGYSPHRPQQGSQRALEPSDSVSPVPRRPAGRDPACDADLGRTTVTKIEPSIRVPCALFNLEIDGNNNYFANGVLVHNCDHLAYVTLGEIRFLMISLPPRMSKTMLCSVLWPDWHWLHIPGEQFLTAGVDDQLARDASILSRRLIESEWWKLQYSGEIELFDDENTAGMYRNRKGGYRMIGSLQGRITGVGGSTQILDDPHDAKKIESDTVRHNALAWHDNAWRSRTNNPDKVKKVYVGQRTHDMDIFGHVLEQEGRRWCHLVIPMEFYKAKRCVTYLNRGDGPAPDAKPIFQDPRTQDLEILEPKRMSAKTVNAEKAIVSEAAWQAQYNQAPTGMGGLILKRHWWRPWVQPEWRANAGEERPMPRFDQIIQVWDTALEESEQDDFWACTTWGTFRHTEQYLDKTTGRPVMGQTRTNAMLLDGIEQRFTYPDGRARAIELNQEFAPDLILVEKKVSGHALIQELKKKRLPVKAVKLSGSSGKGGREGDLVARANSASLMLEKGCIWYPPRPFAYAVIEECAKFPNGDHDDYVSSCTMAWMYLRRYYDLELPDDDKDEVSPWAWKRRPQKRYA